MISHFFPLSCWASCVWLWHVHLQKWNFQISVRVQNANVTFLHSHSCTNLRYKAPGSLKTTTLHFKLKQDQPLMAHMW